MAIIEAKTLSTPWFRSAKRRAAIVRRETELKEMKDAVQRMVDDPIIKEGLVGKEVYIVVEKEVYVEKEAERDVAGGYTELDMRSAFLKGTEAAMAAKDDLAKTMLDKFEEMKAEYEAKLVAAAVKESKLKELIKKELDNLKEKMPDEPKEKIVHVEKIVEKVVTVPVETDVHPEERLRRHISDLVGCEVTIDTALETMMSCRRTGADLADNAVLFDLFDCGVFDELKYVLPRFAKRLNKALGEKISDSEGSHDESDESEDGEEDSEGCGFDNFETYVQFERDDDGGDDYNRELEADETFQHFEREEC